MFWASCVSGIDWQMYVWYQQCEVRFVGVCCKCECRHLLLTVIVAGKMVIAYVHI